jgi:hypothetical protein
MGEVVKGDEGLNIILTQEIDDLLVMSNRFNIPLLPRGLNPAPF